MPAFDLEVEYQASKENCAADYINRITDLY